MAMCTGTNFGRTMMAIRSFLSTITKPATWHRPTGKGSRGNVAKGLNSANQLLYDHLDFGVYRPMLQDDGTPYPQDEDDDYVAPGEFNG